jgi:hypothetical protein
VFSDPVSALADGVDDGWFAELCSEPVHGLLDRGGEGVGCFVPDPLQQFLGGDDPRLRPSRQDAFFEAPAGEIYGGLGDAGSRLPAYYVIKATKS